MSKGVNLALYRVNDLGFHVQGLIDRTWDASITFICRGAVGQPAIMCQIHNPSLPKIWGALRKSRAEMPRTTKYGKES